MAASGQDRDDMLESVQQSLAGSSCVCKSLTKLAGGSANFVYRGQLSQALPDGSETIVIKHSAPYLASNKARQLTTERCVFEQSAISGLEALAPSTHSGLTIQTPKLLCFFESTHTQIYTDLASSIDLKSYVLTHPLTQEQSTRLGYALGQWTKRFHQWGAAPEQSQVRSVISGNQVMKELKFSLNYDRLLTRIEMYPEVLEKSRAILQEVVKDARVAYYSNNDGMSHGDFWTGNVLLKNAPFPETKEEGGGNLTLLVVDWELSQLNSIVYDLGQMFAEMFELKHYRDINAGLWMIAAFLDAYGRVPEDDAFRVAIHMGAHLIGWGSTAPGWGTDEQVVKCVEVGRDYIVNGWRRDKAFFLESPLYSLFTS